MTKEFKHIDDLLKSTLNGYSQEPSPKVWRNISFRLFSLQSGIYLSVLILLIVAGAIYILPSENKNAGLSQSSFPRPEVIIAGYEETESSNTSRSDHGATEKQTEEIIVEKTKTWKKTDNEPIQQVTSKLTDNIDENFVKTETNEQVAFSNPNKFSQFPGLISLNDLTGLEQKGSHSLINIPGGLEFYRSSIATRNVFAKSTGKNTTDYAKTDNFSLGFTITPELIFNESYKNNYALNFDITANYFRNDWFIQAGLGIGVTQDDGIFDIQYAQYDSIGYYNKVNSFSVDPSTGQLIYKTQIEGLYDTVEYSQESITKDYYTYFRLPFYAGINLRSFKRWSVDLKGGAIFSVLLNKVESDFTYDNTKATWIKINDETPVRIKSNIQLSAGVAFNYQINNNLYFQIEPVYSYYLNPVYEKKYNINSPFSLGVRTGLLLKF
ncbi:MAG: hypothetical protein R2750_02770 [Bacteroidales bacterium]